MNEYKLEIRKVSNGYILKGNFSQADSDLISEAVVSEETDIETLKQLFYNIIEFFGEYDKVDIIEHNEED